MQYVCMNARSRSQAPIRPGKLELAQLYCWEECIAGARKDACLIAISAEAICMCAWMHPTTMHRQIVRSFRFSPCRETKTTLATTAQFYEAKKRKNTKYLASGIGPAPWKEIRGYKYFMLSCSTSFSAVAASASVHCACDDVRGSPLMPNMAAASFTACFHPFMYTTARDRARRQRETI